MSRIPLKGRRKAVFDFLCSFTQINGYPPTVREIAESVGLASTSSVSSHLQRLEDLGYIERDRNKPRALVIKGIFEPDAPLSQPEEDLSQHANILPVIGNVAAGQPLLAEENIEEYIAVPTALGGDRGDFILKVRGESMINAGILDGDLLIIKKASDAYNGEIIVALIEDSATVKTFYRESDCIRLQPENDYMEPIYAQNPSVIGKVIGLMRYF